MSKDGGPAFPMAVDCSSYQIGMSLRDYFATFAMQGMVIAVGMDGHDAVIAPGPIAEDAYKMADAMLAERGRE